MPALPVGSLLQSQSSVTHDWHFNRNTLLEQQLINPYSILLAESNLALQVTLYSITFMSERARALSKDGGSSTIS